MITALDAFWVTVAILILGFGFWLQWAPLRSDRPKDRPADWSGLVTFLLSHRTILRKTGRGAAHLLAFWGALVPLTVVILAQFRLVLPPILANFLSLLLDLLGFLALAGTLYFLQQRLRSRDTGGPRRSLPPLFILAFILLTGFLAEGTRLRLDPPAVLWPMPVGWLTSALVPGSPLFLQGLIRSHFFAVLLLTALLPFTFFRHLAAASLNVAYRNPGPRGALNPARLAEGAVGARTVRDLTWKQQLEAGACVSCGRCDAACPASLSGKPLFPRKIMGAIWNQLGRSRFRAPDRVPLLEEAISADEIWACTTCLACVEQCPVFVEPVDKILELRRYRVMGRGEIPQEAVALIRNLELYGDAYGRGAAHRLDWIYDRELARTVRGAASLPLLLWTGCAAAYHPRVGEVGRALVKILQAGGQPFGMLGPEEVCCGDPVRRLGEEALFLDLARKNLERFRRRQVREIVTLCPHCYHTLKQEYPRVAAEFFADYGPLPRVFHAAEYVLGLLADRRLDLAYPDARRIAFHDPCYLGRINGVLDPPRKLLGSLPGVHFTELERHGQNGFCCGGGGGRLWLAEHQGRRISQLRAEEVLRSRAEVLATACPYCLIMLEDGVQAVSAQNPPLVIDLLELAARSLALPSRGENGSEGA